jgi:ferredoxin-NADP reductase
MAAFSCDESVSTLFSESATGAVRTGFLKGWIMDRETVKVVITRREMQTPDIAVIELMPVGDAPLAPFEAGAHIDVQVTDDVIRQYSLSNAFDGSGIYRLGVLNDPKSRGGSRAIHEHFSEGREIKISLPRNHFPLDMSATHTILFGGGIGITPMISMAYALKKANKSFELHYCCRSKSNAAFMDELVSAFGDQLSLHVDDGAEAQKLAPVAMLNLAREGLHVYVCGPTGFMDWIINAAKKSGLPSRQIHFEYFSAEVDTSGAEFEVHAAASGVTVRVQVGMSIAKALKAAGVKVDVSCEEGVCGTCICDVLEGIPDHRDHFLNDEEKESGDQIAVCCSRAKSSRLVLDI